MDPNGAMPARYRHVRWSGLLPCCVASVLACERVTRPLSELQCRKCQAVMLVDGDGAWVLAGRLDSGRPQPTATASLVDEVSDAVAWTLDAHARSEVILSVISGIYHTVEWLHDSADGNGELASLEKLVVGAEAHHERMKSAGRRIPGGQ